MSPRLCFKKLCNLSVCVTWSWKEKQGHILRGSFLRMVMWTQIPKNIWNPRGAQPCVNWGNIELQVKLAVWVREGCAIVFAQWLVFLTRGKHFETASLPILSCNSVICGGYFHILCGSLIVMSLLSKDFFSVIIVSRITIPLHNESSESRSL